MIILNLKLAFRNIFRNKVRTIAVLLTIGICCAVISLIGGFYDYLFENTRKDIISSDGHIKLVNNNSGKKNKGWIGNYNELEPALKRIKGIKHISPNINISGLAGYGDKSAIFSGEAALYVHDENDEEWKLYEGAEVGTILAKNLGIKAGDIINILIGFEGLSFTVKKIISTVSEELDRVYLKLPVKPVQKALADDKVSSISITLENIADLNNVVPAISSLLSDKKRELSIITYNDSNSFLQSVINIYMNNYYFIILIIVLTSFFAIANTITMSIMERVRELGTMRSFGITKKHLVSLFLYEGFFLSLLGFLVGLFIYFSVALIVNIQGGIYIPPPPTVEKGFYSQINIAAFPILLSLGLAVCVSVAASLFATIKINSFTIIEELRYT